MPACRTLWTLSLLIIAASSASAQKQRSTDAVVDTIDIISARPGIETRLLLINSGTHVNVVSPSYPVSAETLSVMTPVRLVLPLARFSLAVTSASNEDGAETIVRRTTERDSPKEQFETTIYSPFKLVRDSVGAALKVHASRAMSKRIQ